MDGTVSSMRSVSTPSGMVLPQSGALRPLLALAAVDACGSLFLLLGSSCFSKHVGQPLLNVLQKARSCRRGRIPRPKTLSNHILGCDIYAIIA